MTIRPTRIYLWGALGVPLLGIALALDGLLTLGIWGIGGVAVGTFLRVHRLR